MKITVHHLKKFLLYILVIKIYIRLVSNCNNFRNFLLPCICNCCTGLCSIRRTPNLSNIYQCKLVVICEIFMLFASRTLLATLWYRLSYGLARSSRRYEMTCAWIYLWLRATCKQNVWHKGYWIKELLFLIGESSLNYNHEVAINQSGWPELYGYMWRDTMCYAFRWGVA